MSTRYHARIAATALAALPPDGGFWCDPYSFARILIPLLLLLGMESLRERRPAMALPMLMVTPRVAVPLEGIAMRVAKAMLA
ncbi:MAG TPA: hypothetical protein VGZ73_17755 [Bryobacteraceae bacterium]|jgi:hypothetical protein|nr:hypothetical protein [Bryobacteraceae bacterium]